MKGCRPMTYQHLTVQMFENAKTSGGIKLYSRPHRSMASILCTLTRLVWDIIDDYVQNVRPLLNSQYDYLLLNRNGLQFQKLTDLLSVLVFQAICKYIHPTRYRHIIETESVNKLDLEEQRVVSEDQKHSSNVARVHHQKLRSRDVALKGRTCMEKLRGDKGKAMDMSLEKLREPDSDAMEIQKADNSETKAITTRQHSQQSIEIAMATKGPVRFSQQEDKYLRQGIEKFGLR